MIKKIVWEKWIDPLNSNLTDIDPSVKDGIVFNEQPINKIVQQSIGSDVEGDEEVIFSLKPNNNVIMTPYGMLSLTEHNLACNQFDFWVMHTNFNTSSQVINQLNSIDGVESVIPLTRYRTIIGFPKSGLFNVSKVCKNIETKIQDSFLDNQNINLLIMNNFSPDTILKIINLRKKLDVTHDYWLIYTMLDGQIFSYSIDNEITYQQEVDKYIQIQHFIGGVLTTCEEYNNLQEV
jgi:hypothetical protein